jgi:hypothetical protein
LYPLAVALLGLLIFGSGCWYRHRCGLAIDRSFGTKHVMASLAGARALVLILFPVCWLLIRHAAWGGTVESNLPPGFSIDAMLGILVVGMFIGLVHAFYSLVEHLNS